MTDWNPATYARFRGLRLRPALDLLAQVGDLPPGEAVDLGCGNGAVGPALKARFPGCHLRGLDNSPAMLAEAAATGAYDALAEADIATWRPEAPPALIFSNAALQWLPDHAALFPRLAGLVAAGGTLAVQMPRQQMAPSHALMRDIAAGLFPDRFDFAGWQPQVADPADYLGWLAPLGTVDIWETEYAQQLAPVAQGHPVRHFTEATSMRPFAEKLSPTELARFVTTYETALDHAYPRAADGTVLFRFRRLFLTLRRG